MAGITYDNKTDLLIVQGNMNGKHYVDQILPPMVIPFFQRICQNFQIQDDNAHPHRACFAVDFLSQ